MKNDPIFDMVKFPCRLTIRQKQLLRQASFELGVSIAEFMREAVLRREREQEQEKKKRERERDENAEAPAKSGASE